MGGVVTVFLFTDPFPKLTNGIPHGRLSKSALYHAGALEDKELTLAFKATDRPPVGGTLPQSNR